MIYHPNDLYNALRNIINLPDRAISIDLHIKSKETPTITIVKEVEFRDDEGNFVYLGSKTERFVIVRPWQAPNDNGEYPGGICCMRSASEFCYEHDRGNYG